MKNRRSNAAYYPYRQNCFWNSVFDCLGSWTIEAVAIGVKAGFQTTGSEIDLQIYGPFMVQQLFLDAPTTLQGAIRVACFLLVTSEMGAVTAEAAGSSPVVPATYRNASIPAWVPAECVMLIIS